MGQCSRLRAFNIDKKSQGKRAMNTKERIEILEGRIDSLEDSLNVITESMRELITRIENMEIKNK